MRCSPRAPCPRYGRARGFARRGGAVMIRRDIEFDAEGTTLRGWFYPAGGARQGAAGTAPAVGMAHGFSAVKEMDLDKFAEVFAEAGLNGRVFANRGFGARDGDPRQ